MQGVIIIEGELLENYVGQFNSNEWLNVSYHFISTEKDLRALCLELEVGWSEFKNYRR